MRKIASLVIFGIMVLSVLGIYASNVQQESNKEYGGFTFYPAGTGWQVKVNGAFYKFYHLPDELAEINVGQFPLSEKIYLAYDPSEKNITAEDALFLLRSLLQQFGTRGVVSCMRELGCPGELPIVNCNDATAPVVYFRSAEEQRVIKQGQCIIIQAPTSADLGKAVEKIGYQLLGVMSNE